MAATVNSNSAAGYQLATDDPVMAIGGFNGTDPAPTLAQFERDVAEKKIHYFISGGGGPGSGGTSGTTAGQITQWVESHFTATTSTASRSMTCREPPRAAAGRSASPVHGDDLAGQVARPVRAQEPHHRRNVLGSAHPAEGGVGVHGGDVIDPHGPHQPTPHLGDDKSGRHDVHVDAVAPLLLARVMARASRAALAML